MDIRRRNLIIGWTIFGITVILGSFGYVNDYFGWPLNSWASVAFLMSFICISVAELKYNFDKEKRAADDFYVQEIMEVFERSSSESKMKFFVDTAGNKCVALTIKNDAIPNSVKLWEGGYVAPPFTFSTDGNVVTFKNSAYDSYEAYRKPGPIYSVKYFPRSTGYKFSSDK